MFIRFPHTLSIMVALATALLTGCSSEPSSSEIKALVDRELKPVVERQARMMSNAANEFGGGNNSVSNPTMTDARKLDCKADGEHAYVCDVEIVMDTGSEEKSRVIPLRLVKGSSGWVLTQ